MPVHDDFADVAIPPMPIVDKGFISKTLSHAEAAHYWMEMAIGADHWADAEIYILEARRNVKWHHRSRWLPSPQLDL